ncbi:MAG: LytTR family DNA-binding domain-containing protein [Oscillospiraceae bacterium]|nr:LytTR family DNA-binding domain-containing protein [Oscillospiraceae bacterium]
MLRIAICEDCPIQIKVILSLLEKYKAKHTELKIMPESFSSSQSLLKKLKSGAHFDLFLLDIQMPGISGMDLAKKIRKQSEEAAIIFLTQYIDYAYEAFQISAAQYLQKPIKERIFFPVLNKVIPTLLKDKDRHYMLSTGEGLMNIPYSRIVCAELTNRRISMHLDDGTVHVSKSLQISFSRAVASLLEDSRFVHVHQAFVVNIAHVTEQKNHFFITKGGLAVPISRNRYVDAKKRYLSYK